MKNMFFWTLLAVGALSVASCSPEPEATTQDSSPAGDLNAADLKPAPDFDLVSLAGGTINSEDLKGKVVVLDFWATWCQPCIKEIPDLNAMQNEQDADQFAILGITIQSGALEDVKPYIDELGIEYPVVMGHEAIENAFGGVLGFPTKFVITPDWKIYKKYLGGDVKDDIEADIRALTGSAETAQAF